MSYTVKWIIGAAERAVAAHGREHVEPRGQYLRWSIEDNRWVPCCLVGHIAVEAGVPIAELVRYNSEAVTGDARGVFAGKFTDFGIGLLAVAQRKADAERLTWGELLDEMRLHWQTVSGLETKA